MQEIAGRALLLPVILGTRRQGRESERVARFGTAELARLPGVQTQMGDVRGAEASSEPAGRVMRPRCGSPTNRHAEKVVYGTLPSNAEEIFEFHTCRNADCRYVLERRAPRAL